MEQVREQSRFKRKVRSALTLRQLIIQKAAMAYRSGQKEITIELLQQNGISTYEFLYELANMEKETRKRR